ncbi:MAG: response regulator, partial [Candidatus Margulisiibacteriota bacterium]
MPKKIILTFSAPVLTLTPPAEQRPVSILYIEDDIVAGLVQQKKLVANGYEVTHVLTGEKALEALARGKHFDLVLTDINLGKGLDGAETARQILQSNNIPIVFMTSHIEKDIVEKVEGISNYGYVVKGSGEFVLMQSLKGALKLFEAKQMIAQELAERKKLDAMLAQKSEMISRLSAQVPGVIYQYRLYPDGRSAFPFSSKGMNDIYEVSSEEVREDATPVFGMIHPD